MPEPIDGAATYSLDRVYIPLERRQYPYLFQRSTKMENILDRWENFFLWASAQPTFMQIIIVFGLIVCAYTLSRSVKFIIMLIGGRD